MLLGSTLVLPTLDLHTLFKMADKPPPPPPPRKKPNKTTKPHIGSFIAHSNLNADSSQCYSFIATPMLTQPMLAPSQPPMLAQANVSFIATPMLTQANVSFIATPMLTQANVSFIATSMLTQANVSFIANLNAGSSQC